MSTEPATLCLVGGGAAATAVLVAWAAHPGSAGRQLVWIAPDGEDGRGAAYAGTDPAHRLNVRAARMSARADRPSDFIDYLTAHHGQACAQSFYPRGEYGGYLALRAAQACTEAGIVRIHARAVAAQVNGDAWCVHTPDAGICAAHLVLAIGPQPSLPLPGVDRRVLASGCYHVQPYAWRAASTDRHVRDIWVIGSALTAVDVALTTARRYRDATIHLLSRHAAFPAAHHEYAEPTADLLHGRLEFPRVSELLRLLREPRAPDEDWRLRVDSLRALTADRWQRWPLAERQRFLRHARWAWDCARHRMAPEVADALKALRDSGQLQSHAGRLRGVRAYVPSVLVDWRPRGQAAERSDAADLVIQATGLNTRVGATTDPLLRSMLDAGAARADDLDLGLAVDAQQRLVRADGSTHPHAYVLGALARGSRFECIAMPDIREQAAAIVSAICATVRSD